MIARTSELLAYELGSAELHVRLHGLVRHQMREICPNGFHDSSLSHCAHFVSHVLGLDFGCTCGDLTGGSARAGNVRVHEIFAHCAVVGSWYEYDKRRDCLIFVSRESAFDVRTKTLTNIPNKHIGIFCGGTVFHYSSRQDAVLQKSVGEFLSYFEDIYGEKQALFFGHLDGDRGHQEPTGRERIEELVLLDSVRRRDA
jgi:hypothetical protein